jgi:serine O-acetyltransferase
MRGTRTRVTASGTKGVSELSAMSLYRVGRWCLKYRIPLVPALTRALTLLLFNCVVPAQATIGRGTMLGYRGIAVVIHERAVIGRNVMIGPCATIGGKSGLEGVPVIGDDVLIGTGAKILGPVRVGSGSVIGANAVVVRDVPPRTVVAGVPARVIKSDVNVRDYGTLPDDLNLPRR